MTCKFNFSTFSLYIFHLIIVDNDEIQLKKTPTNDTLKKSQSKN